MLVAKDNVWYFVVLLMDAKRAKYLPNFWSERFYKNYGYIDYSVMCLLEGTVEIKFDHVVGLKYMTRDDVEKILSDKKACRKFEKDLKKMADRLRYRAVVLVSDYADFSDDVVDYLIDCMVKYNVPILFLGKGANDFVYNYLCDFVEEKLFPSKSST